MCSMGLPSMSALTMARADTPLMSLVTPPSSMPPSSRILCSRLISQAHIALSLRR